MATRVEELRDRTIFVYELGEVTLGKFTEELNTLITAVEEQERERIRRAGTLHDKGNCFPFYTVVASVLTPKVTP